MPDHVRVPDNVRLTPAAASEDWRDSGIVRAAQWWLMVLVHSAIVVSIVLGGLYAVRLIV